MEQVSHNPSKNPSLIRNFCIMAHVDHGKTTLADYLISSNGKYCKGLRYMDSRPDESEKGRTMKSSCVTLIYGREDSTHILNLVDSPGHVDFSSEVSTAVRLCDGTLIVVDVVDGVCPQTKTVLKQAVFEELKPILVMNKIDKLLLKFTPLEVYERLQIVLEQVNAVMGEVHNMDVFVRSNEEAKLKHSSPTKKEVKTHIDLADWGVADVDDSDVYFRPEVGNVIFGSAFDGWGFRLETFAKKFSDKFNMSASELLPYLWGDYYVSSKGGKKKIMTGAKEKDKNPLFVTLFLNNIHQVYDAIMIRQDEDEINKIVNSFSINIPFNLRKARTVSDKRHKLAHIMDKWLPLGSIVSEAVTDILPSPMELSIRKATKLMSSDTQTFQSLPAESQKLREAFLNCSSQGENVPLVVFVSRMLSVEERCLRIQSTGVCSVTEDGQFVQEEVEVLLGFARVFSGTLIVGQKVYVLGPKHDPREIATLCDENGQLSEEQLATLKHITTCEIESLYMLDAQDFRPIRRAFAGMMVGIGGLSSSIMKSGTLSSTAFCPAFTELTMYSKPIFRVAVEPTCILDLRQFRAGLDQLNRADKCVQIEVDDKGQYLLATGGEIHLERCMNDLINTYARVPIKHSPPIIPFRETIVRGPSNGEKSQVETTIETFHQSNVQYRLRIDAVPLPVAVATLLEENSRVISMMNSMKKLSGEAAVNNSTIATFRTLLDEAFEDAGKEWKGAVDSIWSFGPHYCGPNLLFNKITNYKRASVWEADVLREETDSEFFDANFVTGFQTAAASGTLCHEPMMGVAFFVREWEILGVVEDQSISGQVISIVHEACQQAFDAGHRRLMLAMYSCAIEVNETVIGKTYSLIGKRNGRVVDGDITEGSTSWNVTAYLPIIESMKFSDELRTTTSGAAFPQLIFSHWETLDLDPFWKPHTDEELELWGEKADKENLAHQYMNTVRRRKGLPTDEKLVASSEKQRTRSKK